MIENFKPTFIDEERDKDLGHHGVRTTMYSSYSRAATAAVAAPGVASGADDAAGGKSHQSNGVVGNGATGGSDDVSVLFSMFFSACMNREMLLGVIAAPP